MSNEHWLVVRVDGRTVPSVVTYRATEEDFSDGSGKMRWSDFRGAATQYTPSQARREAKRLSGIFSGLFRGVGEVTGKTDSTYRRGQASNEIRDFVRA